MNQTVGKSWLGVVAVATLLAGCSSENAVDDGPAVQKATQSASQIEAGAERAFREYVADINAGDTAKAALIYDGAEGFHWIERGGVEYASGAEAAASLTENFPAGTTLSMDVDEIHSAAMGPNSALVSAHYNFTVQQSADAPSFTFDGWMTVGMVRRAEGWRIAGGQSGPGRSARAPIEPLSPEALGEQ